VQRRLAVLVHNKRRNVLREGKTEMKAIHATPKEVQKVFTDSYIIPDFQRPYSWEREHCETLWDDFTAFIESETASSDEKYFLGNIVIHPDPDKSGKLVVIDGQQRLTTLLLLIKALFTRAGTAKVLEKCLFISDDLSGEKTDELRILSEVIAEDKVNLTEIILHSVPDTNKSKLAENYRFFIGKIDKWRSEHTAEQFDYLIKTLLYKIVLLPIECGSEDDALTIFETINNRGMSLSDADIFKAKLYHNASKGEQSRFISDWSGLTNHDWLFRVYMHILRAEHNDTGKEISLRAFFKPKETLQNSMAVMASLRKIHTIGEDGYGSESDWAIADSYWAILNTYPNQYWNYPLYVFLHKYGVFNDESGFKLSAGHLEEFTVLCEETVRYFFTQGVVYNAVNKVKDTTFRVCAKIAAGGDYLAEYRSAVSTKDKEDMLARLEEHRYGRYLRGLVLLASFLNQNQDKSAFASLAMGRCDIEHILPKKWNNYDCWTEETWEGHVDILGNLMPLEREINISASNEFLKRKKEKYSKSVVQDARDIASSVADNGWTPQRVDDNHIEKLLRLTEFFNPEKQ
jgi:hypothetical protein